MGYENASNLMTSEEQTAVAALTAANAVTASLVDADTSAVPAAGYLYRSNGLAGQVVKAQADTVAHASAVIGVGHATLGLAPLAGMVHVVFDAAPIVGGPAYLSATAEGKASNTRPTIGAIPCGVIAVDTSVGAAYSAIVQCPYGSLLDQSVKRRTTLAAPAAHIDHPIAIATGEGVDIEIEGVSPTEGTIEYELRINDTQPTDSESWNSGYGRMTRASLCLSDGDASSPRSVTIRLHVDPYVNGGRTFHGYYVDHGAVLSAHLGMFTGFIPTDAITSVGVYVGVASMSVGSFVAARRLPVEGAE